MPTKESRGGRREEVVVTPHRSPSLDDIHLRFVVQSLYLSPCIILYLVRNALLVLEGALEDVTDRLSANLRAHQLPAAHPREANLQSHSGPKLKKDLSMNGRNCVFLATGVPS